MNKFLSVFLCTLIIFSIVACKSNDNSFCLDDTLISSQSYFEDTSNLTEYPDSAETYIEEETEPSELKERIELYQIFKEFDDVKFDFQKYVEHLKKEDPSSVIELPITETGGKIYSAYISLDNIHFELEVFDNIDNAKVFYIAELEKDGNMTLINHRSFIRVDNVCVDIYPSNAENSVKILQILQDIGLEAIDPALLNEELTYGFVNTNKSEEDIISTIKSLGYLVYNRINQGAVETVYTIISDRGTEYVKLHIYSANNVDKNVFVGEIDNYEAYLNSVFLLGGHERFIFSFSDESNYAMLIVSNTDAVDKFWDSVK